MVSFKELDISGHSVMPNFYWDVSLNLDDADVFSGVGSKIKGAQSDFAIRCTTTEVPGVQHDLIMVDSKRFMFPEQGVYRRNGQITFVAFDDNNAALMHDFHEIYKKLFTQDGGVFMGTTHKFGISAKLYKHYNDRSGGVAINFLFQKAVIKDFDNGNQLTTGSSPDYFRPTLTVAYGNFDISKG